MYRGCSTSLVQLTPSLRHAIQPVGAMLLCSLENGKAWKDLRSRMPSCRVSRSPVTSCHRAVEIEGAGEVASRHSFVTALQEHLARTRLLLRRNRCALSRSEPCSEDFSVVFVLMRRECPLSRLHACKTRLIGQRMKSHSDV